MKRAIVVGMVTAGAVAGAVRRLRSRPASRGVESGRWLAVTVNRPPGEFDRGGVPDPLARLGDHIEIRTAAAPGGKGTELAARPREANGTGTLARLTGRDPRQQVRQALREAKSLAETGEVMRPDAPPTTRPTVGGRLMGLATRRAGGEGRL
ncbi:hypothetical protein [Actinomadura sp. NTSP31]|uniref:hypothetical protein n=1 Tax=Actinomadura sp. NTSP31 TaxID=1735447 RepID=UPI0035BFAD6A